MEFINSGQGGLAGLVFIPAFILAILFMAIGVINNDRLYKVIYKRIYRKR